MDEVPTGWGIVKVGELPIPAMFEASDPPAVHPLKATVRDEVAKTTQVLEHALSLEEE